MYFKNQFVDLNFLCNLDSSELLFITLGFVFKLFYQVLVYYYRISILVNGMNFLKNNMKKFILKSDMVGGLNFESNTVLLEIENVFKSHADKILDFISEFLFS